MFARASLPRLLCLAFPLFISSLSALADLPTERGFLVPEGEPLPRPQELHALRLGRLGQLVYSHDGTLLATTTEDGRVCLWLMASLRPAYCLPPLTGNLRVTALAFGPRDDWLAIGYNDGGIDLRSTVLDRPDETCHFQSLPIKLAMGRSTTSLLFPIQEDSLLAIGSKGGTGRRWISPFSYGTCRQEKTLAREDPKLNKGLPRGLFEATAWDAGGRHLAISTGTTIGVWNAHSGEKLWISEKLPSGTASIAISPDGQQLAAGLLSGAILLLDVQSKQLRYLSSPHSQAVVAVAFAPDGRSLAAGSDDRHVSIWSVLSTKPSHILARSAGIAALAFRPDGAVLAVASQDVGVTLFDTATYDEHQSLHGNADWIRSIAFSPTGKFLATAADDFALRIWERHPSHENGPEWMLRCTKKYDGMLHALAFQPPDGQLLAVAGESHRIRLVDVSKQDCPDAGVIEDINATAGWQKSLGFSRNGRWLATGSDDRNAWVWNAETWGPPRRLSGHRDSVLTVTFSPVDDSLLATGSYDKTVRIWDASSGKLRHIFEAQGTGVKALAISPDGRTLATAAAKKISLWSLADYRLLGRLPQEEDASAICFSPDGKLLATAEPKGRLRLWNLASQTKQADAELQEKDLSESLWALAVDPQSNALAAAPLGRVLFWQPQAPHIQRVLWQGNQGWATWAVEGEGGRLFRSETGGLLVRQKPGGALSFLEPPRAKLDPQLKLNVAIERDSASNYSTAVATVENRQPAGPALWLRWELHSQPGERNLQEQFSFHLPADRMKLDPGEQVQVHIPISPRSRWWPSRSLGYCLGVRPLYGKAQTVCQEVGIGPWWWRRGPLLISALVVVILVGLGCWRVSRNQIRQIFLTKEQAAFRVEEQAWTRDPREQPGSKALLKIEVPSVVSAGSDHAPTDNFRAALQRQPHEHRGAKFESGSPIRLLLHYVSEDAAHAAEFCKHITPLVREGLIAILPPLPPGTIVAEGQQQQLREADALIALVSADYLAADECHALLREALQLPDRKLHVIPVLVRETSLANTSFAGRRILPEDGRAISSWHSSDAAWTNVTVGVRFLLKRAL